MVESQEVFKKDKESSDTIGQLQGIIKSQTKKLSNALNEISQLESQID